MLKCVSENLKPLLMENAFSGLVVYLENARLKRI